MHAFLFSTTVLLCRQLYCCSSTIVNKSATSPFLSLSLFFLLLVLFATSCWTEPFPSVLLNCAYCKHIAFHIVTAVLCFHRRVGAPIASLCNCFMPFVQHLCALAIFLACNKHVGLHLQIFCYARTVPTSSVLGHLP